MPSLRLQIVTSNFWGRLRGRFNPLLSNEFAYRRWLIGIFLVTSWFSRRFPWQLEIADCDFKLPWALLRQAHVGAFVLLVRTKGILLDFKSIDSKSLSIQPRAREHAPNCPRGFCCQLAASASSQKLVPDGLGRPCWAALHLRELSRMWEAEHLHRRDGAIGPSLGDFLARSAPGSGLGPLIPLRIQGKHSKPTPRLLEEIQSLFR